MYRFTNSWPHLSRTDSAVGKPKTPTLLIFPAVHLRQGGTVYVCNVYDKIQKWKVEGKNNFLLIF